MRVTIDTNADSHENIKKVIKMLQSIVGDDIITNSPSALDIPDQQQTAETPFMNLFGDNAMPVLDTSEPATQPAETKTEESENLDTTENEELFADIFGETKTAEDDTKKPKSDMIEFY